ncbi:MAG: translocation/assembly module TamB domain-containing protein, partial [Candidatus Margulisiibacteriota bacterium]
FSPVTIFAAFPDKFTGEIKIEELFLQGPFSFDLHQAPLLKGKIELDNSLITLSQEPPSPKNPPLNLELDLKLAKNNYAVMGNVMTLNLSDIFMNLEVSSDSLKISGNLNSPMLLGKIQLKRGTINILSREFTLLSPEIQNKFFPYDPEKIQENSAIFSGREGMLPEINLTSSVNVEEKEKDESGKYITKQVIILARLKGTMGAKEGLKISLLSFTEDKTKSPPEMVPAAYDEQELKVMLLPDFIKSLAGISRPEEGKETVDPNLVLADYLNSRVQTLLFRTVERQAEKVLGLESLTLEYNFGPKIREALGVKETKGFEEEKPAWSVGFIKGITDRLYIDVRYAQAMEQVPGTPGQTTFNYQLTYKITPTWSIIYYREPISLAELTTGYQKVTLKAGFSLW